MSWNYKKTQEIAIYRLFIDMDFIDKDFIDMDLIRYSRYGLYRRKIKMLLPRCSIGFEFAHVTRES